MFPFQKIFTIFIRTFSRPMLGYIKQKQQINKGNWVGNLFIGLGRRTWAFEQWTNRRILKKHAGQRTHEIKDQVYLQKGVQFFYEIVFYMIVLGLPFWELYKSSLAAQKKEEALRKRIKTLDKNLQQVNKQLKKTVEYLKKVPKQKVVKPSPKTQQIKKEIGSESPETKEAQPSKQNEQNKVEVQDLLQNALQVMADEFQDVLDDLEFQVQVQSQTNQGAEGDIGAGQTSQEIETIDEAGAVDDSSLDVDADIQVEVGDSGTSTQ